MHTLYVPWIQKLVRMTIECEISHKNTQYTTYIFIPQSRVLLEKLTSFQLVKKLPAFYGTRRFITAFTGARHLSILYIHSGLLIMQQQVNIITNHCFAGCSRHVTCVNSWPGNRIHRKSQGNLCLLSKYINFLDRFEVLTAALVASVVQRQRAGLWYPSSRGSHPAAAVGFLGRKNPQHAFLRRGIKAVGPMLQLYGM